MSTSESKPEPKLSISGDLLICQACGTQYDVEEGSEGEGGKKEDCRVCDVCGFFLSLSDVCRCVWFGSRSTAGGTFCYCFLTSFVGRERLACEFVGLNVYSFPGSLFCGSLLLGIRLLFPNLSNKRKKKKNPYEVYKRSPNRVRGVG
jgi:hypothetical protein